MLRTSVKDRCLSKRLKKNPIFKKFHYDPPKTLIFAQPNILNEK